MRQNIAFLCTAVLVALVPAIAKSVGKTERVKRNASVPGQEEQLRWDVVPQTPRIQPIFGQSCSVFFNETETGLERYILMYAGYIPNKTTNDMRQFGISDHHWEGIEQHSTTSIPWGRSSAASLLYQNLILFIFGGYQKDAEPLGDTWEFDISTRLWKEYTAGVGEGPSRRYGSSIVLRSNSAILFGGSYWQESIYHNDLWSYSFSTHTWTELLATGDSPSPRFGHCAAYYEEYMYIYGGGNGQYDSFQIVWAYSFKLERWGQVLQLPPPKRGWAQSVVMNGWWFIIGGDRNGTDFIDVWRWPLDPASVRGPWQHVDVVGPFPLGRLDHCAVLSSNELYVIGGYSYERGGADDNMWKLNLTGLAPNVANPAHVL